MQLYRFSQRLGLKDNKRSKQEASFKVSKVWEFTVRFKAAIHVAIWSHMI